MSSDEAGRPAGISEEEDEAERRFRLEKEAEAQLMAKQGKKSKFGDGIVNTVAHQKRMYMKEKRYNDSADQAMRKAGINDPLTNLASPTGK